MTDTLILEKLRALPAERRREVVDFIDFLASRPARVRTPLYGLLKDLDADVAPEAIDEARRDAWGALERTERP